MDLTKYCQKDTPLTTRVHTFSSSAHGTLFQFDHKTYMQRLYNFLPFLEEIITIRTCFPFPGFDINDHSPVFLSKVLQDDHIMWLIGIIHINTASPHTKNLEHERERRRKQINSTKKQEKVLN